VTTQTVTEAYPLSWPMGWPRSERPQWSSFKVTQDQAQRGIARELALLGATSVLISTNIPLRKDGLPYSNFRQPSDQGVAVYFHLNGNQQCIPCDKWRTVAENMRAIELTVAALRGLSRWGAKEMVTAAFAGFKALPANATVAPQVPTRPWHEVLEVAPTASKEIREAAYRSLLKRVHPDIPGGSETAFMELQRAFKEAIQG
jgi:DnaJ-domain-containing protein 1